MKVAVIGGGVAGMTAAYCLTKQQVTVDVFEAGPRVGGLAGSLHLWNQTVDIGPHRFFSSDRKVNELWLEVVGVEYEMVNRLTRIYYKNRLFKYPLNIRSTISQLGLAEAVHCVASYLKEKVAPTKPDGSFEAWVKARFGRRLFLVFFKTYTEKLWGMPEAQFPKNKSRKYLHARDVLASKICWDGLCAFSSELY